MIREIKEMVTKQKIRMIKSLGGMWILVAVSATIPIIRTRNEKRINLMIFPDPSDTSGSFHFIKSLRTV
jgi:hypothetical protein